MSTTTLRTAGRLIEQAVTAFAPEEVLLAEADELLAEVARWERMLGSLRVSLSLRITAAGGHEASGGRDPASFLAKRSGSSRGKARAELELAERLSRVPDLEGAVRRGEISSDQARVLAPAAGADPSSTPELLRAAATQSLSQLRQLAARTERAASGEAALEDKERRAHQRRYCRTWVPAEGGVRVDAWITAVDGAKLLAALSKRTDQLLTTRRAFAEPVERVRADALVELCAGARVPVELCVRVDAAALVRGRVEAGEACELPGIGPVSVATARSLLGEAFLTVLVADGEDISAVTSTTRVIPRRVRKALEERDRCCVVPGCGARFHLEVDHWRLDFAKNGLTELDNLCRLCSVHHRQKTEGVLLVCGGPGRWFVRPGPRAATRAGPRTPAGGRTATTTPPGPRATPPGPPVPRGGAAGRRATGRSARPRARPPAR